MDADTLHVLGHAVWSRTRSIAWACSMDMDMEYVLVHAACPSTCFVSMSMLTAHVHAACTETCMDTDTHIDLDMYHGHLY